MPSEVVIHDDWNPFILRFSNDIAILILEEDIAFSRLIRPICLIFDDIPTYGTQGTVVGWGVEPNSKQLNVKKAKKLRISITSNEECYRENTDMGKIAWDKSFCAGKQGEGVCKGDSGGGVFIEIDNKFYFKGLVSSSTSVDRSGCYTGNFSLYTDVAKYTKFILNHKETEGE